MPKDAMAKFDLMCTLSAHALTIVEAESLEAAIDIARDREVWVEIGDENTEWIAREIHGETPEEIRKIGEYRAPVEVPLVHVGGTGADRLFEDYTKAVNSLRATLREMPQPSERDYVRSPGSFWRAMEAHERRVAALQNALDDLQVVLESISSQRDAVGR